MLLDALQCADLRDFIRMQEDAVGCRKWGNQPILGPWKSSRFFPEFGQKNPRLVDEGLHFWHLVLVTLKVKIIDQGAILQAWDSEISKHQYMSHVCWQSHLWPVSGIIPELLGYADVPAVPWNTQNVPFPWWLRLILGGKNGNKNVGKAGQKAWQ